MLSRTIVTKKSVKGVTLFSNAIKSEKIECPFVNIGCRQNFTYSKGKSMLCYKEKYYFNSF